MQERNNNDHLNYPSQPIQDKDSSNDQKKTETSHNDNNKPNIIFYRSNDPPNLINKVDSNKFDNSSLFPNLLTQVNNNLAAKPNPIFLTPIPPVQAPHLDKNDTILSTLKKEFSSTNLDNIKQTDSSFMRDPRETQSSENIPKLQNIVSTVNLKCLLDLREIALKAKNAEYNPRRFAAVIMRIREPKTTALIFRSGKMVCTGAKSEEDCKRATRQFAKIIQKLGFPVKFTEFKIENIVASCDVKFPIRLEGLASKYIKFSSYEPEMFPGLIFHMVEPKVVLLIFVSGKIVLTGAKNREEIYRAYKSICPVLSQYKKDDYN